MIFISFKWRFFVSFSLLSAFFYVVAAILKHVFQVNWLYLRPYLQNCNCFWTLMKYQNTQREKCPYSDFFWSVFSHIRSEFEKILSMSPYSVRIPENTDQKNSKYGHFAPSDRYWKTLISCYMEVYLYKSLYVQFYIVHFFHDTQRIWKILFFRK